MVMDNQDTIETLPAPDIVGREFVRQYYTLLHEAPEQAHRFYNSNSYFVHGAMTKPAIGQLEIHQKIQQLNFRDCHAKISQVDSQVTLGNGVVVQVSGELSNDGEPMRRFSQTFVLGTQSPKKYYVHNDIFRYQDMLQSDEEGVETPEKEEPIQELPQEVPTREYYPPTALDQSPPQVLPLPQQQQPPINVATVVNVNGTGLHHEEPLGLEQVKQLDVTAACEPPLPSAQPVMNGGPLIPDMNRMIISSPGLQEQSQTEITRSASVHISSSSEDSPPKVDNITSNQTDDYGWDDGNQEQTRSSDGVEERKTYANLFKSANRGPHSQPRNMRLSHSSYSSLHSQLPHIATDSSLAPEPGNGSAPPPGGMSGESRRPSPYPDTHQVFIGNLPTDATDAQIKNVFSAYGRLVDLRISLSKNSKSNFGFITFEKAESAADCIQSKPIKLDVNGKTVELNVEEKRTHGARGGGPPGRGRGSVRGSPRGRGSAPLSRSYPPRR